MLVGTCTKIRDTTVIKFRDASEPIITLSLICDPDFLEANDRLSQADP